MKKSLILFLLVLSLLLSGCNVEKKVLVKNTAPDNLFIDTQKLLKAEMPAAKIQIDLTQRVMKIEDSKNTDYPSYVEMKFSKALGDTEVTVIASDEDPQKIDNLRYLLLSALPKPDAVQEVEEPQPADEVTAPAASLPSNRAGRAVRTKRDMLMDRNKDGWVGPREIEFFKTGMGGF